MQLAQRARAATSPSRLFVQLNRDLRKTTLIVSTGRSGSTWLGEMLTAGHGHRLIFEPFAADRNPIAAPFRYGMYLAPGTPSPVHVATARTILTGAFRNPWADRFNHARAVRRRVVKAIRITNLVPWLAGELPELRIIYLVRHPVAVALSMQRLQWGDLTESLLGAPGVADTLPISVDETRALSSAGPFEAHVVRWCIENRVSLTAPLPPNVLCVSYQSLVDRPADELQSIASFVGLRSDPEVALRVADRPSRTTWETRGASVDVADADLIERAGAVLARFGIPADHRLAVGDPA